MSREREIRRKERRDEERETRRQLEAQVGRDPNRRVIVPETIFPTRARDPRRVFAWAFLERIRRDPHRVSFIEHDARMIEVACSCGFVMAAPFGVPQAERIREEHWSMFHVIPDATGARYRA